MVDGMRVHVSTVAFSNDRLVIIAAMVIATPSQGPPTSCAASEKYPVCHFCQFPNAASENIVGRNGTPDIFPMRSEEHTSELQSHHDLVCRLLLEIKNGIDKAVADTWNT